ncbi:MAG: hypothetical protein ACOYKA_06055 [Legionellaceae bacterium]
MFLPHDELLERELYETPNNRIKPRLTRVTRQKNDFFFPSTRPAGEEHVVDCYDRFQHWADVRNEVRKILIKPLVALNLSIKKEIDADSTLLFLVIDLITCADEATLLNTSKKGAYDLFLSLYYTFYAIALALETTLEFLSRTAITIAAEITTLFLETTIFLFGLFAENPTENATAQAPSC